jgi:AcrR family transcriptional regulator
MARPRSGGVPTKQRLLETAAAEFAARGFDGAKVDRIAARARINKAMLYYHFPSKAALYLAILREQFGALAVAAASARAPGAPAPDQLCRFIDTIAREAVARPTFPAIWLREIAEGGRHLDATVVASLRCVLATLAAILDEGRRRGQFTPVNPLVVQIGIVAPLMFFAASGPFRERVGRLLPAPIAAPDLADMIAHVQAATLAMLGTPMPSRRRKR